MSIISCIAASATASVSCRTFAVNLHIHAAIIAITIAIAATGRITGNQDGGFVKAKELAVGMATCRLEVVAEVPSL